MIVRVWYGYTAPTNVISYESLLRSEIFIGIMDRGIAGFREIQLLRRDRALAAAFQATR